MCFWNGSIIYGIKVCLVIIGLMMMEFIKGIILLYKGEVGYGILSF